MNSGALAPVRNVFSMFAPEYVAVRHILTAPVIAERLAPHIGDDHFAWDGILEAANEMSAGQATLVKVALDLWNGDQEVGVWDLPKRLGPTSFDRVVEAMHLYRGEKLSIAA